MQNVHNLLSDCFRETSLLLFRFSGPELYDHMRHAFLSFGLRFGLTRQDLDRGCARTCIDHRREIWTAFVLSSVRVIDAVIDRTVYWLEGNLLRYASGADPSSFLSHRSLIPTRLLSVVTAHVEFIIKDDRPNPRRRAVSFSVLPKR